MSKNFSFIAISALLFSSAFAEAADPVITYVTALQRGGTKLVDIWYGVTDGDGDSQNVSLQVNVNGASIGASSFSGDTGDIMPGNSLHIVWDADTDWNKNFTNTVSFEITADNSTPSTVTSNMVFIPSGTNSGLDPSYGPYSLTNNRAFYMDKYEITNDEMVDVMQWAYEHGKLTVASDTVENTEGDVQELLDLDDIQCRITWDGTNFGMKATYSTNYPCIEITWYGTAAFCNYRSEKAGLTPCYNLSDWSVNTDANGYRLPFSDEWEYAARGGSSGLRFPWGNEINHDYANYIANGSSYAYDTSPYTNNTLHPDYYDGNPNIGLALGTSPVNAFELGKNGYGLYDMAGNCWEWCYEWYPGYENSERIRRGGSWRSVAPANRCGNVYRLDPPHAAHQVSFRTLLTSGTNTSSESSQISVDTRGESRVVALSGDLAFDDTVIGFSRQRTLTIHNNGDGILNVTSPTYPAGFSGYWSGAIPAGGAHDLIVSFSPTATTNYTGDITIISDATSGNSIHPVSGRGTPHDPQADYDGDGFDNETEATAGTDPNNDLSFPEISDWGNIPANAADPLAMPELDFDGDGKSDPTTFGIHDGKALWYILLTGDWSRKSGLQFGNADSLPVRGDFNGDGRSDLAVFQPEGLWYISYDMGRRTSTYTFGDSNSIPATGDFDGDGSTDLAVYQKTDGPGYSAGQWYTYSLTRGDLAAPTWGNAAFNPAPADYDGDQITDFAVYNPGTALWYVLYSSYTGRTLYRSEFYWGNANSIFIASDMTGSFAKEFIAFNTAPATSSEHNWYTSAAENAGIPIQSTSFGNNSSVPVSGDFDGDTIDDYAVFNDGQWYIWKSTTGTMWMPTVGSSWARPIPQFHR